MSEILRRSAEHTKWLLGRELEIRLGELNEAWHAASLERIFIENKLYQLIEGSKSREEAYAAVDKGLEPFKKLLRREVTLSDVQRLTELKFIRISRYDSDKADNEIRQIEEDIKSTQYDLNHLTEYAVAYYERIRDKYGKGRERRTELREFDNIEATKVAVTNAKLYVDRAEGFFGIGKSMKDAEPVCDCSDIDDVIVVAFGTAKKEAFTGSATVIKSDDIAKSQQSNVAQALAGKVAGVQLTNTSGQPGESPTIRIRGFSSLNAGNDPLWIVDGMPYSGDLNNLNPSDIESMTVLKDAASNSLYGARGANGVVMITTKKKAKSQEAHVTIDAKWGVNSRAVQDYTYITNPAQFYELHYSALKN